MSEHSDQAALFAWAATMAGQVPELRLMFAIVNAGKRSPAAVLDKLPDGGRRVWPHEVGEKG